GDALLLGDAELARDDQGRCRVVSRDHDGTHAGALGAANGVPDLLARWVDHPDQTEKNEVLLELRTRLMAIEALARDHLRCDGQRSERFPGESLVRLDDFEAAVVRERPLDAVDELVRTPWQEHIRR